METENKKELSLRLLEREAMSRAFHKIQDIRRSMISALDKYVDSDTRYNIIQSGFSKFETGSVSANEQEKLIALAEKNPLLKRFYEQFLESVHAEIIKANEPKKEVHNDRHHAQAYCDNRPLWQKRLDRFYNFWNYLKCQDFNYGFALGVIATLAVMAVLRV